MVEVWADVKERNVKYRYIHLSRFRRWAGYGRRTVLVLECCLIPASPSLGRFDPCPAYICNQSREISCEKLLTPDLHSNL